MSKFLFVFLVFRLSLSAATTTPIAWTNNNEVFWQELIINKNRIQIVSPEMESFCSLLWSEISRKKNLWIIKMNRLWILIIIIFIFLVWLGVGSVLFNVSINLTHKSFLNSLWGENDLLNTKTITTLHISTTWWLIVFRAISVFFLFWFCILHF